MEILVCTMAGFAAALLMVALWTRILGFPAQRLSDYAGQGPEFDIREQLDGPIQCEGVIYGPTGRVASRFTADMHAVWKGNVGTMTEHFRYDSGNTQDRVWTLTLGDDGRIHAEAPDLIGVGDGGQKGSAVRLNYRIKLPDEAGGHVLDVIDWMYLIGPGKIVNRSQFRKFGIKVAEIVATMRRQEIACDV